MEGWLYGLFTLLGVFIGGLFTYLGLRSQLKQQKVINKIEWRRKVRSDPLLKLRNELASLATKYYNLMIKLQAKEETNGLNRALDELTEYAFYGDFLQTFYIQYDAELKNSIEEIRNNLSLASEYASEYKELNPNDRKEYRDNFQKISFRITEVQELINKKLEEL
jgi:hypothetical protein